MANLHLIKQVTITDHQNVFWCCIVTWTEMIVVQWDFSVGGATQVIRIREEKKKLVHTDKIIKSLCYRAHRRFSLTTATERTSTRVSLSTEAPWETENTPTAHNVLCPYWELNESFIFLCRLSSAVAVITVARSPPDHI